MREPDRVILAINILNLHAELASVLEEIFDQTAHIPGNDPDFSYSQLVAEDLDIVLDDGPTADLKHHFGHVVGRRICPYPRAGCRYEPYVSHRIPAACPRKRRARSRTVVHLTLSIASWMTWRIVLRTPDDPTEVCRPPRQVRLASY